MKTDRRDAERLVRLLAADELHRVVVPGVQEEALRGLLRAREDLRGDLMRARHRLAKLLLRHEVRFAGPQANWTQAHVGWLGRCAPRAAGVAARAGGLSRRVYALMVRREQLETEISGALPGSPSAQTARRLMCLRAIDTLPAAGWCAEIGDFHRFGHPAQHELSRPHALRAFLGRTPPPRATREFPAAGIAVARRLFDESRGRAW